MKIATRGWNSLAATAAVATLWFGVVLPAHGQVYPVGCDADDLVDTVRSANSSGGTIELAPGCEYVLGTPAPDGTASALPTITGEVEILGNGARLIAGGSQYRFFFVSANATLTLRGMVLAGAHAPDGADGVDAEADPAGTGGVGADGGAIENHGTLVLDGVHLFSNNAGRGGDGGGCYGKKGLADTIHHGGFGGRGGKGGAIFNAGRLEIGGSIVAHNVAGNGGNGGSCFLSDYVGLQGGNAADAGGGGGIWSEPGAVLIVERTTFFSNVAGDGGYGGIGKGELRIGTGGHGGDGGSIASYGSLTIEESVVESSQAGMGGSAIGIPGAIGSSASAAGNGGRGGGIAALGGRLDLRRSTIFFNVAGRGNLGNNTGLGSGTSTPGGGGGVYLNAPGAIENATLFRNTATVLLDCTTAPGSGGGIYLGPAGNLDLDHSTLSDNVPGQSPNCGGERPPDGPGRSIFNRGTLRVRNSILSVSQLNGFAGVDSCAGPGTWIDATPGHNIVWYEPLADFDGDYLGCPDSFLGANPVLPDLSDQTTPNGHSSAQGGPTQALGVGSAALDAGDDDACAELDSPTDQRGIARPLGDHCEIGAYETGLTLIESPSDVTVAEPAPASFSAVVETDVSPSVRWQQSKDKGSTWNDAPGSAVTTALGGLRYRSTYRQDPTSKNDNGSLFRAVFSIPVFPDGVTTASAKLTVRYERIVTDLPDRLDYNVGDAAIFTVEFEAFPAITVNWEVLKDGSYAEDDPSAPWIPFGGAFTAESGATIEQLVTFEMYTATQAGAPWRYRLVLEGGYPGRPVLRSNVTTVYASLVPFARFVSQPRDLFASETDQFAIFGATVAGHPLPLIQWQVSTDAGANWAFVFNGLPNDPEAYRYNTSPEQVSQQVFGLTGGAGLRVPARGDRDGLLYRAVLNTSVFSEPARLWVRVPTRTEIHCPRLATHLSTYQCKVDVTPQPLHGPRPRPSCGKVDVLRSPAGLMGSCTLDATGSCALTFNSPPLGTSDIMSALYEKDGGPTVAIAACAGGDAPPDLESLSDIVGVNSTECTAPSITACAPQQSIAVGSDCQGQIPDLTGLLTIANAAACPADVTQSFFAPSLPRGEYEVTLSADNGIGVSSCTTKVVLEDKTPPVVTLAGDADLTLFCPVESSAWLDPKATASDSCDSGPLDVSVSVRWDTPTGVGTIVEPRIFTYSATDANGNTGSATRTVLFTDPEPPAVTLRGDNPATVECGGGPWSDPGASADDACVMEDFTVTTHGSVDTGEVRTYLVGYSAEDLSANQGSATRRVDVVDTLAPVITVNGVNPAVLNCGESYTEAGATANDACDGSFAAGATGSVDSSRPGEYTITYRATDHALLSATPVTRKVTVMEKPGAPVLTCPSTIELVAAPGTCGVVATFAVSAKDACGGDLTVETTQASGSTFPVGRTTVTASAIDATGDRGTCSFDIVVMPRQTQTSLALSPATVQYSDPETFTAGVVDSLTGAAVGLGSVRFEFDEVSAGTFVVGSAGTATVSVPLVESALFTKAALTPGPHTVKATYLGDASACWVGSVKTETLTIVPEDAGVLFTGIDTVSACDAASRVVTLSATVRDITAVDPTLSPPSPDTYAGRIDNATARFVDRDTGAVLCSSPVNLIDPAAPHTGQVICDVTLGLGRFRVGLALGGHYRSLAASELDQVVEVVGGCSKGANGNGDFLLSTSAGAFAGDVGSKAEFGFDVKADKKKGPVEGKFEATFRRQSRVYKIAATSITSLETDNTVTAAHPKQTAVFFARATITDVTDPKHPIAVANGANAVVRVSLTDGKPGPAPSPNGADSIGFAVWYSQSAGGALFFASQWNGAMAVEQILVKGGGDVDVK